MLADGSRLFQQGEVAKSESFPIVISEYVVGERNREITLQCLKLEEIKAQPHRIKFQVFNRQGG